MLPIVLLAIASLASAKTHLYETFTEESFKSWVPSNWKGSSMGVWDVTSGEWNAGDDTIARGIRTSQDARFYAISKKLDEPFSNEGKPLVIQYAVKNEKKGTSFCGGGYIKLLPTNQDLESFGGDSPYYIMFGPDLCGYDVSRVHLIFNSGGENMLKKDEIKLDYADKNEFTHLYTLILRPDNTYSVLVDKKERASGSLGDGQWSKFPLKEIDDPSDVKPADWVDEPKMVDPAASKPEDWDETEPKTIKDPTAEKPSDWDEEEDGEWEAPMIDNEKYKGKWVAPKIDNPAYKGPWTAKKIANPAYTGDSYVYKDIGVVGFELWVVNSGSIFSNVLITDSEEEAQKVANTIFSDDIVAKEKEAKKEFDAKNSPPPSDQEEDIPEGLEEDMDEDMDDEENEEL